jgi:hypothetical protein
MVDESTAIENPENGSIKKLYLDAARSCQPVRFGKDEPLEEILFDEDVDEAFDIEESGIQANCSVVNVRKARLLAMALVSQTGELLIPRVRLAKELLESRPACLAYGAEEQRKRDNRFLKALTFLCDSVDAQRLIKKMSRPLTNRLAENAIRDTLLLPENQIVTDIHVRQAVVASLLTTLRQSLGSCFATAPAIIVHEDQPLLFLRDLDELMGTAKLKRTVAGNEYSVPMSASWGQGDLKKPLPLTFPLKASQPIWRSASLVRTLTALGVIASDEKREKGYQALYSLIEGALGTHLTQGGWMLTNVEEILKLILLRHLNLSEKELYDFESRPKAMMQTTMVVAQPETKGSRAEADKQFARFFSMWDEGRRLFKAEADCALLKSWEFTIASFAEVKFDLARWNFYSSLGVNWDDVGGIGNVLYEIAKKRVEETNLELEQNNEKYDAISLEIDYLARRMQQASTEGEAQWIKVEYQSRQVEQYHIKELCDMAAEKANKVAHIHQFLIDEYDRLMKEYFQEIYDADLHDIQAGPFDDAPAGFRLIYKYGRTNPSLWTKITSLDEYVQALVSFFTITEQELLHAPEVKGIEAEFSSIITRLANHVRSDEFLESALTRTAIAHGVKPIAHPLQNLEQIEKKPWVYTSGGNMNTLVSSYFGLEGQPEVVERWVESETELLAFLIDTVRQSLSRAGRIRPTSLLMHSPTHAFSLQLASPCFEDSWSGDAYSYSWIVNHVRDPGLLFYSSCVYDPASVAEFCSLLSKKIPPNIRARFMNEAPTIPGFLRPYELAKEIERLFSLDIVLRHHVSILQEVSLASMLFESSPFTSAEALRDVITDVLTAVIPKEARKNGADRIIRSLTSGCNKPISAKELLCLLKTLVIRLTGKYRFESDLLSSLLKTMRGKRLLPPCPLIFADSNWIKDVFAFVMSPISQQIELWSVNAYGTEGRPIQNWKMWVDGSRKDGKWGVLINPNEYRAFLGSVSSLQRR